MIEFIYLAPGERMPDLSSCETWLTIEASDNGRFFGTGCGRNSSGEDVFYVSAAESDGSLEAAVAAATNWANERGVRCIWVQATPE